MKNMLTVASVALIASATALLAAAPQDKPALKGAIKIDGSSTVYPITEAVAEELAEAR